MVSTYTPNKQLEQPGFNDYIDTWDVPVNNDWSIIDLALGGSVTINTAGLSGVVALTLAQYKPLTIRFTGTPAGAITYSVPSGVGGQWVVRNDTNISVGMVSLAGGATVAIPAGTNTLVTCDGTATGMRQSVAVPPAAAGAPTCVQFNNGGLLAGSSNLFWDGTFLWSTGIVSLGNSVLGLNSGNYVTINASSIDIPNNAVIGAGSLLVLEASTGRIGIGLPPAAGDKLTVGGVIHSTAGGIMFPDNTIQTSAASTGAPPGGADGNIQYKVGSAFGGTNNLTYNSGTGITTALHLTVTGNASFNTLGGALANFTNLILTNPLPIAYGGTAGANLGAAQTNLDILPRAGGATRQTTGDIYIGQSLTPIPGSGNSVLGGSIAANGSLHLSHNGFYIVSLNRNTDGDCIVFSRIGSVIGNISLNASQVFYNTTSDYRIKTATGPVTDALDRLDLVPVYRGHFNATPDTEQDLILAHDLAMAVPYAVTGEKDGADMQQVSWSTAVPWLIAMIKELKARVDYLSE